MLSSWTTIVANNRTKSSLISQIKGSVHLKKNIENVTLCTCVCVIQWVRIAQQFQNRELTLLLFLCVHHDMICFILQRIIHKLYTYHFNYFCTTNNRLLNCCDPSLRVTRSNHLAVNSKPIARYKHKLARNRY